MTDEPILCLVRDLLFYSKIRAAAETAGMVIKTVRDPLKLVGENGAGLIVDLNQTGALEAASEWRRHADRQVIGFVSHVDIETIHAARHAGINRVFARSQFEKQLPAILGDLKNSAESVD